MKFLKKPSVFSKRIWGAIVLGTAAVLVALGLALAPANEAQADIVEAPPAKIVVPKEAIVITPQVDQPTVYNTQRNETVEQPELVARTNITITSPLDVDQLIGVARQIEAYTTGDLDAQEVAAAIEALANPQQ